MAVAGSLIRRQYADFRGVDFSNKNTSLNRSPDALNMWKDYKNNIGKCVKTRPDIALLDSCNNTVYGLFFYDVGNVRHKIVHCGTKLYDTVGDTQTEIYSGMNVRRSNFFVYNQILYIQDGIRYLTYNGTTCTEVTGYVPTTTIGRNPAGGGQPYEDVNLLTGIRKNSFCADGESTDYYLDTTDIDSDYTVTAVVNGTATSAFTVNTTDGVVSFTTAPSAPLTDGQDNVVIMFRKTISGYRDRIDKCTLLEVFDNRVFFSENPNYPNVIFHSSLDNPTYISDTDYYNEGLDLSPVRSLIAGNNALWVCKEPSQANTTVFYHTPVIDSELGKIYPSTHSSISVGCVGRGINFNDDIVFFSDRGMEGISSDVTTEQVITHRSSLVDNKLLNEANYKDMILQEFEGYLLVIIGKHVYLADSRAKTTIEGHLEYEWFYWELSKTITCALEKDGVLYLGSTDGIYTLTKTTDLTLNSYWTTAMDSFGYPAYQKTTNKKGCVIDMEGNSVTVSAKLDNNSFETIGTFSNTKGYVVPKIKEKKWKTLQLKLSAENKILGLYSVSLEAFVGGYVKR